VALCGEDWLLGWEGRTVEPGCVSGGCGPVGELRGELGDCGPVGAFCRIVVTDTLGALGRTGVPDTSRGVAELPGVPGWLGTGFCRLTVVTETLGLELEGGVAGWLGGGLGRVVGAEGLGLAAGRLEELEGGLGRGVAGVCVEMGGSRRVELGGGGKPVVEPGRDVGGKMGGLDDGGGPPRLDDGVRVMVPTDTLVVGWLIWLVGRSTGGETGGRGRLLDVVEPRGGA